MKKKLTILGMMLFVFSVLFQYPLKAEAAEPSSKVIVMTVGNLEKTEAKAVVEAVNEEREAKNLKPLIMTKEMEIIATHRAAELSAAFSHIRPNGQDGPTVLNDYEIESSASAENIASAYNNSADEVMDGWMKSDEHRANILSDTYTHIGVSCFDMDGRRFWVQVFTTNPKTSTPIDIELTGGLNAWPYEIDTEHIAGCSLEFVETKNTLLLGGELEFDLVLYGKNGMFLGVVYSDELSAESGEIVIEGSDLVSVSENMIKVAEKGKLGEAKITVNVGKLTASKTIEIDCKHSGKVITETENSTCEKQGYKKITCDACGNVVSNEKLPLADHDYKATEVTKKAGFETEGTMLSTCGECGKEISSKIAGVKTPKLKSSELVYSGKVLKPEFDMKDTEGKDLDSDYYEVSYDGKCILPGSYKATISLKGNYEGTKVIEFKILPAKPSNVKATLTGHDDVKLTWNAVESVTGYDVYYKKSAESSYKLYKTTTDIYMNIANLYDATKYDFRVVAYYENGTERYEGTPSSKVSISTLSNLGKPENIKAVLTGHDDVKVTWKKVKNADRYYIYFKKNTAKEFEYLKYVKTNEYSLKNGTDGVKYTFKIVPAYYDKTQKKYLKGFKTAEVSVYTLKKMKKPEIEKLSSKKIEVSWSKLDGASGYQVSRSTSKTGTNIVSRTVYTRKEYTPTRNKTYYYKIRAYKTEGNKRIYGPWSDVTSYSLRNVGKISKATAVLNGGYDDIKLSWSKATDANKYQVYWKSEKNKEYKLLKTTSNRYLNMKNYQDGIKYTFKVVPVYMVGNEIHATGKEAEASVYTLRKLAKPSVVKDDIRGINVSWENINGESGYQVSCSTSKSKTNVVATEGSGDTITNLLVFKSTSGTPFKGLPLYNKTHYYKVRAYKTVNGKRIYGPWSDVTSFIYRKVYDISGVSSDLDGGYDDIKVTWNKTAGANKYLIYEKSASGAEYQYVGMTSNLYWKTSDKTDGIKYTYKIVPAYISNNFILAEGEGAETSVYSLIKLDKPRIEKYDNSKVFVAWNNIRGESGYQISRSTKENGKYVVATYATTTEEYTTVASKADTVYYYRVRAYKIVDGKQINGPWSEPAKFVLK